MRRRLPLIALALLAAAAPAAAIDLPARKVGLWQLKMSFEGRNIPPQNIQQCIDAETDKLMNSFAGNLRQDTCSKQDIQRVSNTIVVDSVCQIGQSAMTSHAVITGDFDSAYTVKVTSRRSGGAPAPGMPADGTTNMTLDATWLGACKADQRPGDMIMADGRKMNVRDLQNMPGGRPPGATGAPGAGGSPQKK